MTKTRRRREIMLVASFGLSRVRDRQVHRFGGLDQDGGNGVFRCALGTGMTAHAYALLAAAHPEPAVFTLQGLSRLIQQFELQWLVGRDVKEEGTVLFYRRTAQQSLLAARGLGVQADRGNRAIGKRELRRICIQAEDVRAVPIMQTGRVPVG